jgi:hypothetical protein
MHVQNEQEIAMDWERRRFSQGRVAGGRWLSCAAAALVVLTCLGAVPETVRFKVVVHADNPVTALSASETSALFLKRVTQWTHGGGIRPVDQAADSAVRTAFSRAVHGRTTAAIKSHWLQVVFSGRGTPPPELSEAEVVQYVRANPGAIGYVSAARDVGDLKVVTVRTEGR